MGIYSNHKRIYENFYGPIPEGMEIHHIDGNTLNNNPENLKAVTLQEHYEIHFKQGDYGACRLIAFRMKNQISNDEKSKIASLSNAQRIKSGTHNFLKNNKSQETLIRQELSRKKNIEAGLHNFIGGEVQRKSNRLRVSDGTHHFVGGELQREMLADGRHASCHIETCRYCGKKSNIGNISRWHNDRCKKKL